MNVLILDSSYKFIATILANIVENQPKLPCLFLN
jgi:hypothetical protein